MEVKRDVILVDKYDKEIRTCEKGQAHSEKLLHRAFSLFLFNKKGELLLQKRNKDKYHSGGLWSNSCCSHPRSGKDIYDEVNLRALDELGIHCHSVEKKFSLIYDVDFDNNSEYEYDHVFFGLYDGEVPFNKKEVMLHNLDCTQEEYIRMISLKTATFFSGVCGASALLAKGDEYSINAIENYGYHIGIAYQIYDDIIPFISDDINKDKDCDIHRRLVTLPIIISYQLSDASIKQFFELWYQKNSNIYTQPNESYVTFIREVVGNNIHDSINIMHSNVNSAIDSLNIFEDSPEKDILISFANKLIKTEDGNPNNVKHN